ncbi:Nucleolar GTP-binding protein 2 [Heterocephalus glaber]|uniref:Nucleolar GTP-binding protein 2 n=1 Tax=Heterocephalus glaber TaxID=10181 RepID=G5C4Q1_HETGA|nr:Nucleolar GTP-binding protein 2 [Heterocephalus glaber]
MRRLLGCHSTSSSTEEKSRSWCPEERFPGHHSTTPSAEEEYPTLAFHASLSNPFGKRAFIQLLRQFGKSHTDKKQIRVGFISYPNVGKSSMINTLHSKKVCDMAPIAGETKAWQCITLMLQILFIDCPASAEAIGESVLRTFLRSLLYHAGKLLKGGEPDFETVGKMVLNDWQWGRAPFLVKPTNATETTQNNLEEETAENIGEGSESVTEKEKEDHPCDANSEMQQILAWVQQNFGKINVVPQFSGDDLDPVEVSDNEEELESFSAAEKEEEQKQEQPDAKEEAHQQFQEQQAGKDTKAVIKALDEKIVKYQKFLNKAKAKKFSAVRIYKVLSEKVFAKSEEQKETLKEEEVNETAPTKKGRKWKAQREEEQSSKTQRPLTCKEQRQAARNSNPEQLVSVTVKDSDKNKKKFRHKH